MAQKNSRTSGRIINFPKNGNKDALRSQVELGPVYQVLEFAQSVVEDIIVMGAYFQIYNELEQVIQSYLIFQLWLAANGGKF